MRECFKDERRCYIVKHPDKNEFFCDSCHKKFVEPPGDIAGGFWLLILAVIILAILLSGCGSPKANVLLLRISDASASAVNNSEQSQFRKQVCLGIADAAKSGDQHAVIAVHQEIIATDAERIQDQSQLYRLCHEKVEPQGQGTFVCPALALASDLSDRTPDDRPFIVLQIQANETETFCPDILENLANKVTDRGGKLVIVGSTNDGNTGFNTQLWQILKLILRKE